MKRSTIIKSVVTLVFVIAGMANAMAQKTVTVNAASGTTLYLQGYGTSTAYPGPVDPQEDPDLVTTGTKVPYLVIPDATLNPTWAAGADATNTTGIIDTWTWTIPGAISATAPGTGHFTTLDINGVVGATGTISVAEQGAGCPGTPTTINLKVVAQPTATAMNVSDGTAPLTSICAGGTNGSLGVALPTWNVTSTIDAAVSALIGGANVKVKATLVFTDFVSGTPTTLFTNAVLGVSATGDISNADLVTALGAYGNTLKSWGTYALTVNSISDQVSRKDLNVAGGYFAAAQSATYTVLKTPTTGAIYHLPNK